MNLLRKLTKELYLLEIPKKIRKANGMVPVRIAIRHPFAFEKAPLNEPAVADRSVSHTIAF